MSPRLRGSRSSGLPEDPNLDDATLRFAMDAADGVAAAGGAASAAAAAADFALGQEAEGEDRVKFDPQPPPEEYCARFEGRTDPSRLYPEGLPQDSQFRAEVGGVDGLHEVGMMDSAEADSVEMESGAPGEVVRVVLAVCRAFRIKAGGGVTIDNRFEYLVALQDREGEEWVMGSVFDLPQCQVLPGQDVLEVAADLLQTLGFDQLTCCRAYTMYIRCIYRPADLLQTLYDIYKIYIPTS